jgi:hypothetical protein
VKTRELLLSIANLWLEADEGTADWVNVKALRYCWYLQLSIIPIMLILALFVPASPLLDTLRVSVSATWAYRFIIFLLSLSQVVLVIITVFYYYRYVLGKGARIYLVNVIWFYTMSILWFALSYFYLYLLSPNLFIYEASQVTVSSTMMRVPYMVKVDFFLFSAFQSVNGSYFHIRANSALVSVLIYVQALFTISLIALLIASYVNQKTNKPST